jgi:hypothetical protein
MVTINVGVTCTVNSFYVYGTVTGLTAEGLQLINGSTTATPVTVTVANAAAATAAAPLSLFGPVLYNATYGISILTQPTGQTCTVTNGNGVMGDAAVTNVAINCVNNS